MQALIMSCYKIYNQIFDFLGVLRNFRIKKCSLSFFVKQPGAVFEQNNSHFLSIIFYLLFLSFYHTTGLL